MIRYVIWDVDGALLNTYPAMTRAMCQALEEMGGYADRELIERLILMSSRYCSRVLAERNGLCFTALKTRYEALYANTPAEAQRPFPGVARVCAYIRAIGGKNFVLSHRDAASLETLLGTHRLSRYFDDQVTAEEGLARKPDPEGVEWLIGRHALPRDEVLLVGDREADLFAGQAAGVRTCRFGSALPVEAEADWVIRDYDRLLRLLCTENLDEDWLARDHGYMMGVDRLLRPIHT